MKLNASLKMLLQIAYDQSYSKYLTTKALENLTQI